MENWIKTVEEIKWKKTEKMKHNMEKRKKVRRKRKKENQT
jgi:hypothetical protein